MKKSDIMNDQKKAAIGEERENGSPVSQICALQNLRLANLDTDRAFRQLRQSGALLLHGFDVSLADFETLSALFCDRFHDVGTRRELVTPGSDGYTSQVHQKNFNLFAHSEGAYRPWPPPPDLCFFNCVQSWGNTGGATTLIDGVKFLVKLPAGLRKRFEQQGIIYAARWEKERWQTEFSVDSPAELHAALAARPAYQYQFDGDAIHIRCHTAAISKSLSGIPAFANGLLAHLPRITHPRWRDAHVYSKASNRIYFGDGEEIQEADIHTLIDIQDEITLKHDWVQNDILILDNKHFMHGRCMTEGECERVIRSRFGMLRQELQSNLSLTSKAPSASR